MLWVQVSPHEFMQVVMRASNKRFTIEQRGDPVEFWSWFLNSLHLDLTGGKRKKPSVISRCFQVTLRLSFGCTKTLSPAYALRQASRPTRGRCSAG